MDSKHSLERTPLVLNRLKLSAPPFTRALGHTYSEQ